MVLKIILSNNLSQIFINNIIQFPAEISLSYAFSHSMKFYRLEKKKKRWFMRLPSYTVLLLLFPGSSFKIGRTYCSYHCSNVKPTASGL